MEEPAERKKRKRKNPKEAIEKAIKEGRLTAKDFPLTDVDRRILQTLARVRFATERVLVLAGVGSDAKHLKVRLWALRRLGLIGSCGVIAKKNGGRLAAFYKLTHKGAVRASLLVCDLVKEPQGEGPNESSYAHAEGVARTVLALHAMAAAYGGKVGRVMLAAEMETEGTFKRRAALTWSAGGERLEVVPDILAGVTLPDGRVRPLAVEYENGANRNDARHAVGKRKLYGEVLERGLIERALGCEAAPRVLVICSTADLLRKVWEGWAMPSADDWSAIYMQAVDALEANPLAEWYRIGEEPTPLFKTA